jgi:MFS transporter, DHA1 family, tetracycline resistance protein
MAGHLLWKFFMKKFIKQNPLPVVLFTIFLDMLGYGILIPIIPQLFANPGSSEYLLSATTSLKTGYLLLGFLLASFPLMQFLATPILGQLSDIFGRKKILGISLAGTCLSYILFALGIIFRNIPLLFFSRSLDGLTGGNIAVAQAAIADVTEPKDRAKNFGLIGAVFGIGFILGPFIGGKLSDPSVVSWFSASTPFWFAGILSFINTLSVVFLFPETNKNLKAKAKITWNQSIQNIKRAFETKSLNVLYSTVFLFQTGFAFFIGFFSVFLITKFSFAQGQIGNFFAVVGICVAFTQAVVTRQMAKKFNETQILKYTLIATGITLLCYFLPTKGWQVFLVIPFFAVFNGLSQANIIGLVSRSAGSDIQGEVLGINSSVNALAQSFPPIISGILASQIKPSTPILVSGVIIILAGLFFVSFFKEPRQKA